MTVLVAAVLVAGVLAAVLYPLARRMRSSARRGLAGTPAAVQGLLDRRETLLAAMTELEYDRKLGNVSEEEHRRMGADYESQVIAVLRALDRAAAGLDEVIDREVREVRARRASDAEAEAPDEGAPAAVRRRA